MFWLSNLWCETLIVPCSLHFHQPCAYISLKETAILIGWDSKGFRISTNENRRFKKLLIKCKQGRKTNIYLFIFRRYAYDIWHTLSKTFYHSTLQFNYDYFFLFSLFEPARKSFETVNLAGGRFLWKTLY